MVLLSPGVEVTVVDQTVGTPGPIGSLPLILVATREDKVVNRFDGAGYITVADGTRKENAGKVYLIAGRTELLNTFGDPEFERTAGGDLVVDSELHEWGLHAAWEFLGQSNLVYVVRADIDLGELSPSATEPTSEPATGTWWLDLNDTVWGIARHNGNPVDALAWDAVTPQVYYRSTEIDSYVVGTAQFTDSTTTPTGVSGTLTINGTNITLLGTETLQQVADAITTAGIADIRGHALRWAGNSYLVIRNTAGGAINISGTAATGFGLSAPTLEYMPSYDLGNPGDVGVLAARNDNMIFEKMVPTDIWGAADPEAIAWWFPIGSDRWKAATPTVVTGTSTDPVNITGDLIISDGTNSVTITFPAAPQALATVVSEINSDNAAAPTPLPIQAQIVGGALTITNYDGGNLSFSNTAGGNATTELALNDAVGEDLTYAPHTQVPASKRSGSYWIRTTEPGGGAHYDLRIYDSATDTWTTASAPLYADDDMATADLGNAIPANTLYVRYNVYGTSGAPIASHVPRVWNGQPEVTVIGTEVPGTTTSPTTIGDSFVLIAGQTSGTRTVRVVTLTGVDAEAAAYDINALGIPGVVADVQEGFLRVRHVDGHTLTFSYVDPVSSTDYSTTNTGDPLAELGIAADTLFTNWADLTYTADYATPAAGPTDGQLWYHDVLRADIMVNDGDQWRGYRNQYPTTDPKGPIISATAPTAQSDGTPLVDEDLWIDTSNLDEWPKIYRWRSSTSTWEPVDNTDQVTPLGIVFADARPNADGQVDGSEDIEDLLTSDYVDPDAPDPRAYPAGTLLFNLRWSGRVVRRWTADHFASYVGKEVSPGVQYEVGASSFATDTITDANRGRWVTVSGVRYDGSPYTGRRAVRRVVVDALRAVAASDEVRSESIDFDLLAAPGYPELIDDMVGLSHDRGLRAFVIGDTPLRLSPTAQAIADWSSNAADVPSTDEDGLASNSELVAVYYPWGIGRDTRGREVIVPPSTMALPTYSINDRLAAPWFAPAGFRRGVVASASAVGYLNPDGEFETVRMSTAQRDAAYLNRVNPIVFIPGRGIVLFGQKTLYSGTGSALGSVNVVRLTIYLRRVFEAIARPYLFELNDEITRGSVTAQFTGLLTGLISARALYDFVVVCDETNNTPERIDRNELWVDVAIQPARAVEFIYIPLRIVDTGEALV